MGIYAQVLWNTGHGRPFSSTLLADNSVHLAEHVAPVLAVLTPLYGLAPEPAVLLVLQQLFLAAAGLPLYLWARNRTGEPIALALLAAYYAMPAMSRVALSEFHPVVLAALPAALGVAAALDGRARAAAAWLVAALLFEEESAPLVGAAGAYLLLVHRRRTGLALGLLAALWLGVVVSGLMPAVQSRSGSASASRTEPNRVAAHFDLVRERPALALEWLGGPRGAEAAAWLLAPAAGLPLLAPDVLALAAPSFLVLFLQDRESTFAGHWSAPFLPICWFAAAAALGRLASLCGRRRDLALGLAVVAVALASGLSYARYSLFPGGRGFDVEHFVWTEREDDLARAAALVPPAARLDATRRIVPHLAQRAELYQFPSTFYSASMRPDLSKVDVFLLDLSDSPTRRALDPTDQDTLLTRRPRLNTRLFGDDVLLLSRERPSPSRPASALFGETLRLNGYDLEGLREGVRVSAYWEPVGRTLHWTRVAELLDADGRAIIQVEAVPLDPVLPPERWERGQLVVESIDLRSPTALMPGLYRASLGWRDAEGRAVRLADGSDHLEIGPLDLP